MRFLLFGATGFIGRHVRERVAGAQVVTVSRTPGAGDVCLDLASAGSADVAGLIDDAAPDVVINCAGVTRGDPRELVRGNVVAVANLIRGLAVTRPTATRLVHLGSAAEYGAVPAGVPVTEAARPNPVGPYGVTKLAGTEIVRASALDAVVLRVFNPIGPGVPASTLAGRVLVELRRPGDEIRVGSLAAYRDFVDVRDVADAVFATACAPGPLPRVLNVGSGEATSLREVVHALIQVSGAGRRVMESASAGSDRSLEVHWQQAHIGTIGRVVGWRPATGLTTSLLDLWKEGACLT
jgi:nucleoside-diphosphate-sugar epimerase